MTLLLAESFQASLDKLMPGKSYRYAVVLVTVKDLRPHWSD
jgi:hypothetical protein